MALARLDRIRHPPSTPATNLSTATPLGTRLGTPLATPLRVALDGTPLLGLRTGVAEVASGLLTALSARDDVDPIAYAVSWSGRRQLAPELPRGVTAATASIPARVARALWERADRLVIERWTGPVDVVHALNFVAPPAHAPVVVMIHDLTVVRYPELCTADTRRYPAAIARALRRGAHVHVPSDFVADEVRDAFDLDVGRVTRVYSGLSPSQPGDATAGRRLAGADRYVLAVGTVEPRKNLPTLVRAFDALAARDDSMHLVIAGPDGWGHEQLEEARARARHRDRIRRLGYVTKGDRSDLIAGTTAFAYPSIYEGFGFPPLEAMAAGVPVVAARAGALPEVLGDAALLVDPADDTALADALERAVADDGLRTRLIAAGRARSARYTWPAAAAALVDLYRSLA